MNTVTIEKSMFLAAPKDKVWAFLTKADALEKWFHPPEADLVEGEDYILRSSKDGDRMCWGRVEKTTPPDYMEWSFTVGPLNGKMTKVEWMLEEAPGGTRLTLRHSGLPETVEGYGLVLALDQGWHGCLGQMQGLADPAKEPA